MKAAFAIPVYRHGRVLGKVLERLLPYGLPFIVVDDGNSEEERALIQVAAEQYENVTVVRREKNGGKGMAMRDAALEANRLGFTHIFQVDSDGQHDAADCGAFLEAAREHPDAIICGYPIYDHTVPPARKNCREFSNAWARIASLNGNIKDVLCGFRIYPLEPVIRLLEGHAWIDARMGYDVDILVHLLWMGVPLVNRGVHVSYPEDGVSNFHMLWDNVRISLTFTRLCIGMLVRLPVLVYRKCKKSRCKTKDLQHWSQKKELAHSDLPLLLLILLVKILPFPLLSCIVALVGLFYTVFSRQTREEALRYQNQLIAFSKESPLRRPNAYAQITSFALCLTEKVAAWSGKASLNTVIFHDDDVVKLKQQLSEGKGAMIISSHLGNMELLRCLASYGETGVGRKVPVTAIMDMQVSPHFSKTLGRMNSRYQMDIIASSDIGIDSMERLQQTLEDGGLVVIAGDRTSASSPERSIGVPFLGKEAPFPYGAFLLASMLCVPVYFVFSLRQKGTFFRPKYNMFVKESGISFDCPRKERKLRAESLCRQFAGLMERYCLEYPLQWYNFFDFWLFHGELDGNGHEASE
ncbi:MAG: glycosyltransferase family 2 protein [Treponema sp.]|nr:glycosyltransferase family 2 protein [Treponema sp.]